MIKPNKNSDVVVAQVLFDDHMYNPTRRLIAKDGPEAVKTLNLVTEGFSSGVRDEVIKLVQTWWAANKHLYGER